VIVEVVAHGQHGPAAGALPHERRVKDADGAAARERQQRARVGRATVRVGHGAHRLVLGQGCAHIRPRREAHNGLKAGDQRRQNHDGAVVRREAAGRGLQQDGQQRMHRRSLPHASGRPVPFRRIAAPSARRPRDAAGAAAPGGRAGGLRALPPA